MFKPLLGAFLAALVLAACSSAGSPAGSDGDSDYWYGRHAGQSMRGAPDSY